jgi:hypothetical protein
MSDDVIDLNAERIKRAEPETCDHVTRATFEDFFFGTGEATPIDPPMVLMSAFGGGLLFEAHDARRIAQALIEHADEIDAKS